MIEEKFLLEAIDRARALPLARWLHALAIPEIGEETAHDLASFHKSLEDVASSELLRDVVALDRLRREMAETNPPVAGRVIGRKTLSRRISARSRR